MSRESTSGQKILIVDDAEEIRLSLSAFLRSWRYTVVQARDGEEAWNILLQSDISLVVSDWSMPVLNGLELCNRIRAASFDRYIYFILLTANTEKADMIAGMEAGADDFLGKPFDQSELRVCIRAGERILHLERRLKQQQEQIVETNAALIQTEKLATLGAIASSVAHELNSPLGAILNAAERVQATLENVMPAHEELQEDIDLLIRAALHSRAVVADLLVSARTPGENETCNVAEVVDGWLRLYKKQLELYGIEYTFVVEETRPVALSYPALSQALTNVLMNARDALIENTEEKERYISLRAEADASHCIITVQDNGSGISAEVESRLFDAFVTSKEQGKGTGLGLWVTRSLLKKAGGGIVIRNREGGGAEVVMILPLAEM
ncbi:MAG: sensor histidine kinase [Candidatus Kapaibacteriota bacterium]|jgi:signal transduction histidine kinase